MAQWFCAGQVFLMRGNAEQPEADPTLRDRQPWKAVHEKDQAWLGDVITKHYEGDDTLLKEMGAGLLSAYAEDEAETFAGKAEHSARYRLHRRRAEVGGAGRRTRLAAGERARGLVAGVRGVAGNPISFPAHVRR